MSGMAVWSKAWPGARGLQFKSETTDFLTNSSGQATNVFVSLFSKQYNWYHLASGLVVLMRHCAH